MSYSPVLQAEGRDVSNLGLSATQDMFNGAYGVLLGHWFPGSRGYIVANHALAPTGKYRSLMVRHGGHPYLDPVLILVIKRPSKWTAAGRQMVMDELADRLKRGFDHTQRNIIYGLGGIGLHWVVCKMTSKDDQPTLVLDWQDDIISDASYSRFEGVAELVYNIASE